MTARISFVPPSLSSSVRIRHMTAEDLPAMEWEGAYTHFRRQFEMTYRDYLAGRAVPWVAVRRSDNEMLGQVFVLLRSRLRFELADGRKRAYLYSIRVRPAYRRMGLGSWLMDVAENDLVERGCSIATLNVARDNPGAYRFYVRRGYQIVAPDPGQWSYIDHLGRRIDVDEPAWRMAKDLRNHFQV